VPTCGTASSPFVSSRFARLPLMLSRFIPSAPLEPSGPLSISLASRVRCPCCSPAVGKPAPPPSHTRHPPHPLCSNGVNGSTLRIRREAGARSFVSALFLPCPHVVVQQQHSIRIPLHPPPVHDSSHGFFLVLQGLECVRTRARPASFPLRPILTPLARRSPLWIHR
jgi:hypothetical protein